MKNEDQINKKARAVARVVSSMLWGGEHGWEDETVGEKDLADAFLSYYNRDTLPLEEIEKCATAFLNANKGNPTRTATTYTKDYSGEFPSEGVLEQVNLMDEHGTIGHIGSELLEELVSDIYPQNA